MNRSTLVGAGIAHAVVAALVFVGVAITELNYVFKHPYAYGPGKVLAWGAGAGAVISVAVGMLAVALRPGAGPT